MMNFKLLGVLQDFGTPYASLYLNTGRDSLFVVIEQGRDNNNFFIALALSIDCQDLKQYLDGKIGLRSIARDSALRFVWKRKKGTPGSFAELSGAAALSEITDDEPFDPDFCSDMPLIISNISHLAC